MARGGRFGAEGTDNDGNIDAVTRQGGSGGNILSPSSGTNFVGGSGGTLGAENIGDPDQTVDSTGGGGQHIKGEGND